MNLAVDIFDQKTERSLEDLAEDAELCEAMFSPLGLKVEDVWRFDDEFGVELKNAHVSLFVAGDPRCDLWESNTLINSRFGQGGYIVFRISSMDQVGLKRIVKQLVARFEGAFLV